MAFDADQTLVDQAVQGAIDHAWHGTQLRCDFSLRCLSLAVDNPFARLL